MPSLYIKKSFQILFFYLSFEKQNLTSHELKWGMFLRSNIMSSGLYLLETLFNTIQRCLVG